LKITMECPREKLGDAVFIALATIIGRRQIARIRAYAQRRHSLRAPRDEQNGQPSPPP